MLKAAKRNAEELLLRQNAAKGEFKEVQGILNRNKTNLDFLISIARVPTVIRHCIGHVLMQVQKRFNRVILKNIVKSFDC